MTLRINFVCLCLVLFCFTALAQPKPTDDVLDRVEQLLIRGLTDQAVALLKTEIEKTVARHDGRRAALLLLRLSHLYKENGQADAYINALFEAMPHAHGTDLEPMISAEAYLA